jgi:Fe-S oxidoreductase
MDIKVFSREHRAAWLLWVGCTNALMARNVGAIQALARLLSTGGVEFAILGDEEMCCGHPARRMGDERLFQSQARRNIEVFRKYGIQRVVTACPHCYDTIKYEYPQLDGEFEVWHHTELLATLLKNGELRPTRRAPGQVSYHDPCYLGRYNRLYEQPRAILSSAVDAVTEMPHHQGWGFCCGAGGGNIWLKENCLAMSRIRVREALSTGVSTLATACPFCLESLSNGLVEESAQGNLTIKDLAEIIDQAL